MMASMRGKLCSLILADCIPRSAYSPLALSTSVSTRHETLLTRSARISLNGDSRCSVCCHGNPYYQPIRMAGHSHWHNIRHTKGLMDARRQKESSRIMQKIRLALRGGGNADPTLNRDLQRAIDEGRAKNIPLTTMLESVKKAKEGKEEGSEIIVEARGFANCLLIIECFSDKQARTRKDLTVILKKYGGAIVDPGVAAHMFDYKGVLAVAPAYEGGRSDGGVATLDIDTATELAIETGAEEVNEQTDEDNQKILQFVCDPKEMHRVKKALEAERVNVLEARLQYLPHTLVKLQEAQLPYAADMLEKLEAEPDVLRIYDNIQAEGES